jgi:hypothetical protein
MSRLFAIAMMFALAAPTLAVAEEHHDDHHPPPGHGGPPPGAPHPMVAPHPMAAPHPMMAPHPGGPAAAQFVYRGHPFNRVHMAPFAYPSGWAYRRWEVGAVLPPLFLVRDYYYADWAGLGLPPPQPGFEWVRYGPDLLLVNVTTGQVVDVAYGVFY